MRSAVPWGAMAIVNTVLAFGACTLIQTRIRMTMASLHCEEQANNEQLLMTTPR